MEAARYAPHVPLPAAAFVPGRAGSARPAPGALQIEARTLPPNAWRDNEAWLYGVDLWNHGFLWEAHEAWEKIWRAPFDSTQAGFLRGMIQCAAAALKVVIDERSGAASLSRAGIDKLEQIAQSHAGRYMGLDARAFAAAFRTFVASMPDRIEERPRIELG